jgi:hypothetical protein
MSASIKIAAVSECIDTALSPQNLARHACPTRPVSDTPSRVVQTMSIILKGIRLSATFAHSDHTQLSFGVWLT